MAEDIGVPQIELLTGREGSRNRKDDKEEAQPAECSKIDRHVSRRKKTKKVGDDMVVDEAWRLEENEEAREMVRRICIIVSVRSSHSLPLPFTIPLTVDTPTVSPSSSIKSAFAHVIMIGTPARLSVNVPEPRGRSALDIELSGEGSEEGSV